MTYIHKNFRISDKLKTIGRIFNFQQAMNGEQEKLDYLKERNLLELIVEEIKKNVVSEDANIKALIIKITLRLVKNATYTSSNLLVSGDTGAGKDNLVKAVCNTCLELEVNYFWRNGVTQKIFNYWNADKKDFTWRNKVVFFEDPSIEFLNSPDMKTMGSGNPNKTVVKDQKTMDVNIEGKPILIITSKKSQIEDENVRRYDNIEVDESIETTNAVIRRALHIDKVGDANTVLQEALKKNLFEKNVRIPFEKKLYKTLPMTLVMRTNVYKLLDFIRASCVLYQHQREKDEDGYLIATYQDYDIGYEVFKHLLGKGNRIPLSSKEREVVMALERAKKDLNLQNIANGCKNVNYDWLIRKNIEGLRHIDILLEKKAILKGEMEPSGLNFKPMETFRAIFIDKKDFKKITEKELLREI